MVCGRLKRQNWTLPRFDARPEILEARNKELERVAEEKTLHISDLKAAHERQISEKEQRINDKTERINDLKADHEKERETYLSLLNTARDLIQSQQAQIAQLEAPKQPIRVREAVETEVGDMAQETAPTSAETASGAPGSAEDGELVEEDVYQGNKEGSSAEVGDTPKKRGFWSWISRN